MADKTLKEKIAAIDNDDPVREILEGLLDLIEAVEAKVNEPPIKQGGKK